MGNSIYFTEEHEMLRDQIRRFLTENVQGTADAWERDGMVPRQVLKDMGSLGLFGIRYPEKYGGSALNTLSTVVLAEELGKSTYGGFAITALVHTDMASPHLFNAGNEEQLDRFAADVIAGEKICAVAVTEPGAGSDVAGLKTRATPDGKDWILNGTKMFITNGVHADLYFVAARTNPDAKGSRGVTMFIVEKGMEGFSVGRALDKQGWRSSDTAELIFDNVRIPAENILGGVNEGFYAIMKNFQNERTVLAAQTMGEAEKALELTLDYVKQRQAFGANLWDLGVIQNRLAVRSAEVEAGKQLTYHAAWLDAQGQDCVKEVSMAKVFCGELVNKVMYDCQQFHGGFGYMREAAIERMVRDARVQSIGGGATEVMAREIAKRI